MNTESWSKINNKTKAKLPRCFRCFKEHKENETVDLMFCSDKCSKEWHNMTKDWKV